MKNKVVLIGCGSVGMSYAYALLNQKTSVMEFVLVDIKEDKVVGEVMDLNHGLSFAPHEMSIKAGTYADCKDADIVVITAGIPQKIGETRMDLLKKNHDLFASMIPEIMKTGFDGIFLIATNPLDVVTYFTWKYSGLPAHRVLGSGTTLDTSRLRYLIGKKLEVSPKNIHAYVMGEHGDSEFVPWSNASVGLQNIREFLTEEELEEIYQGVRDSAYEIQKRKGDTSYGIGMCLVRITNAILDNQNSIMTVSSYDKDHDVYISTPTVINRHGVREKIWVSLTQKESEKLQHSIQVVKNAIESAEKN